MPDIQGAAASVEIDDSTVAPRKPPMHPGIANQPTTDQSTLRSRQCEIPEDNDVPSSARCTEAEAMAGAVPTASSPVLAVTPKAMPREPSINWAAKPASATMSNLLIALPASSSDVLETPISHKVDKDSTESTSPRTPALRE